MAPFPCFCDGIRSESREAKHGSIPNPINQAELVPTDELAQVDRIGRLIFEDRVRPWIGTTDQGQVVVIDVKSGEYEADFDDATALFNLIERCPDAFTWTQLIGHSSEFRMGFGGARPVSSGD